MNITSLNEYLMNKWTAYKDNSIYNKQNFSRESSVADLETRIRYPSR